MKKMKQIIKKTGVTMMLLALVGIFTVSCEDDDKNRLDDFELGGFVRFAEPFPTIVNISSLDEVSGVTITTILEAPDGNVASYTMEVSALVAGTAYGPVPFGSDISSFPTTITFAMTDLASSLGIDMANIGFGDTFTFKGTAINNNGVVYSSDPLTFDPETGIAGGKNSSADLIDELGYRNAFRFGFAIPCPPINNPIAGDWIINMTDLYGDGWDGAFITVNVDGTETDYTIGAGAGAVHVVNVPTGTGFVRFTYNSGAWEEEHVYSVDDPTGATFGPYGPNPEMCPEIGI